MTTRIDDLVREFASGVSSQTDAMRFGDSTTGNKHAKRYLAAFEALRRIGDEGRDALAALMAARERSDVRGMAAAFLLRHRHDEARRVLEELSRGRGFDALEAGQALQRWDDKTWQLDPAPVHRVGPVHIRDISIRDVAAGYNWWVDVETDAPSLLDFEVRDRPELQEADTVAYSGLAIRRDGLVRPILVIREVGTYEWWGDTLEYFDGAWHTPELSPDPIDAKMYIAAPLSNDPSFMGGDSAEIHRICFAAFHDWLPT